MAGSTKKFQRAVADAARRLVEAHGGTMAMVQSARGHPYIEISLNGISRKHSFSCSPRDADVAIRLVGQDVRRMIREILLEKARA